MRLFESDNIWKRRKRAQARANAPDTPERRREEARQVMTSQFLWLFGAVLLDVLGLAGLKLGVISPDVVTVGFLIVLRMRPRQQVKCEASATVLKTRPFSVRGVVLTRCSVMFSHR